jgi:hypothetical protein
MISIAAQTAQQRCVPVTDIRQTALVVEFKRIWGLLLFDELVELFVQVFRLLVSDYTSAGQLSYIKYTICMTDLEP